MLERISEASYIDENQKIFLDLIDSISETRISNEEKEKLKDWLVNSSDFFIAPASHKGHSNHEGGLCVHSLNVYFILKKLVDAFVPDYVDAFTLNDDSLKIVGLFHDLSKANYFTLKSRNTKDEITHKWKTVKEYSVDENRFIYGNREETSEFMIRSFINLKHYESTAILHCLGGSGYDSSQMDIPLIFKKDPLAVLLHVADMLASYITESDSNE